MQWLFSSIFLPLIEPLVHNVFVNALLKRDSLYQQFFWSQLAMDYVTPCTYMGSLCIKGI
jgi:hypothetical protein